MWNPWVRVASRSPVVTSASYLTANRTTGRISCIRPGSRRKSCPQMMMVKRWRLRLTKKAIQYADLRLSILKDLRSSSQTRFKSNQPCHMQACRIPCISRKCQILTGVFVHRVCHALALWFRVRSYLNLKTEKSYRITMHYQGLVLSRISLSKVGKSPCFRLIVMSSISSRMKLHVSLPTHWTQFSAIILIRPESTVSIDSQ